MKTKSVGIWILGVLTLATTALADTVRIPVSRVFVPATGYDNNDNVVIRAEGTLPDPCYVLGEREINRSADGKTFSIVQTAWRNDAGACGSGDLLSEATFSVDVSLGRLRAGSYRVKQTEDERTLTYVPFAVAVAPSSSVDDYPYANTTQISVDDLVNQGQDVLVALSGLYSSSCAELANPIITQKIENVFVIKPIEVPVSGVPCDDKILRLFKTAVHLGPQAPGEYLVQVRAQNGRAVEQTFQVLDIP